MKFKTFEEMPVWQDSCTLTNLIYTLTLGNEFSRDFGLKDQIRRSAVSIMSNISEGYERSTKKEFAMFLGYAKGSAGELRSQLYIAADQKYISTEQFQAAHKLATDVSSQLAKFAAYLRAARAIKLTSIVTSCLILLDICYLLSAINI
jgi:four helix bundle protein